MRHKICCAECERIIPYSVAVRDGYSKRLVCKECYTPKDRPWPQHKPRVKYIDPSTISPHPIERTSAVYVVRWGMTSPFRWGVQDGDAETFWSFTWGQ